MGQKLKAGGYLVGLWSWTYDAGNGIDDSLVAISGGGDVLVWQLTDPASPTGTLLRGVWYVGGVVSGRRICTDRGGDLLIASALGIVPISQLVAGVSGDDLYNTWRISPLYCDLASTYGSLKDWALHVHPNDNTLVLMIPTSTGVATQQLAMSFSTKAWSQYADLPMFSAATWVRDFYFGTIDGKLMKHTGNVDNVLLSDSSNTPIEWRVFSAYQNLGNALNKQVQTIRPVILSGQTSPLVNVVARYDYDLTEASTPSGSPTLTGPLWDSATWDEDVWGGDYSSTNQIFGAVGQGRHVAIAARGKAVSSTVLVGFDVTYTMGGPL
jgi:hypothetical protein